MSMFSQVPCLSYQTHCWFRCPPCFGNRRNNRFDAFAVLVKMPTSEMSAAAEQLQNVDGITAATLAGKTVGRVSKHLYNVLWSGMTHGWLNQIKCIYTGQIIQGGPVQGGGPMLSCAYVLDINPQNQEEKIASFTNYLRSNNFSDLENLYI